MAKKKFDYLPILGIAVAGAAGFFIYRYVKNKKTPPSPEPTPEPTPEEPKSKPKAQPKGVSAATSTQKKQLQDLLISLYSKYTDNKIVDTKYTASEAAGGWGRISEGALRLALSASTGENAYTTPLDSSNAARYIKAVTAVNADRANQLKTQQTKQTEKSTQVKSAKEIIKLLDTGNYKAALLVDVTSPAIQFDAVKQTYITLGNTKKFSKGTRFFKGDFVARGDGSLLYKSGLIRYPINPNNLLTSTK
jgi:hypothetical protein